MEDRPRHQFSPTELSTVLGHYDLGVVNSIAEFKRGSPQSPKASISTGRGRFLLKRRAPDRSSERKIAFANAVQEHLVEHGLPVPMRVPTRLDASLVLDINGKKYELFEFVEGESYAGNIGETVAAGGMLARVHDALLDFPVGPDTYRGSYHDVIGVRTALNCMPDTIAGHDSVAGFEFELNETIHVLYNEYDRAAEAVNALDQGHLPSQVIHADWHPGNVLFRDGQVVAVLDFDSCRLAQRVVDLANGLLHFSLVSFHHPNDWPDHADMSRISAFAKGYQSVERLSETEIKTLPHLMIEAMIAESVLPIIQTGQFGQWAGFSFLRMVARKVAWIESQGQDIRSAVRTGHP